MKLLFSLLKEKRELVLNEWIVSLNAAYPLEAVGLMRSQKNSFANPIGGLNTRATAFIYDALVNQKDVDSEKVYEALEELIALRAIQDMSASQALAGIIVIKSLLNKHILSAEVSSSELKEFYKAYFLLLDQVDALILIALDVYSQSKEKVYRIRVDEIKKAQAQVLKYVQKKELI